MTEPAPTPDREFGVSYFKTLQDNLPRQEHVTWARTARALTRHMAIHDKEGAPLWSPAVYPAGAIRAKANVQAVSLLVFDIDDGLPVQEMRQMLGELRYVISSSYSHSPRHPKYRVVIDLVEPIPAADYNDVWRRANRQLAGNHVDPATKDPSRMFFFPSHGPSVAEVVAVVNWGEPLDWRQLEPLPPPPPMPVRARRSEDNLLRRRASALLSKWTTELASTVQGARHETLVRKAYAVGGLVAAGLVDEQDAREGFLAASQANGLWADDGDRLVERAVDDGLREGQGEPWTPDELPDSPAWTMHSERFRAEPFAAPTLDPDWPVAERLEDPPVAPLLDIGLLPRVVGDLAADIAERQQAPVDYAVWGLLVTLAGLVGKVPVIRPREHDLGWSERAALWVGIMGPVSANKSSVVNATLRPLYRQREVEHVTYEKALAVHAAECIALQRDFGKAADLPPKPEEEDVITSDATTEKLAMMIRATRRSTLTVHRDELAGWLLGMDRYHAAGGDREFYLQSYSGGPFSVHRIGRPSLYVPDLLCNVLGTIQPDKAGAVLASGPDDGLVARFCVIWPEVQAWQMVDRAPNLGARDAFDELHERLVKADWHRELQVLERYDEAPFVRLAPDAQPIFNQWYARHMSETRSRPRPNVRLAGRLGKYPGLVARLMLVFHLADWASGATPYSRVVSADTVRRVVELVDGYCQPMDERVYHAFGETPSIQLATRLANKFRRDAVTGFTVRQACRWLGSPPVADVRLAIEWLAQRHWCRELDAGSSGRGRPSEPWAVNPNLPDREKTRL